MTLPDGWNDNSYMRYQREHLTLRLTLRSLSNRQLNTSLAAFAVGIEDECDADD